jgi:hypothetical protein
LLLRANGTAATGPWLRTRLRELLSRVVTATERRRLGLYSLRKGGATAAFAAGIPPPMIQLMGRWRSDAYLIYCSVSVAQRLSATAALATMPGAGAAGLFESLYPSLKY